MSDTILLESTNPIWDKLVQQLRENKLTPILGPGVVEHLTGSHESIAKEWAKSYGYPLSKNDLGNLPQIAQYLSTLDEFPEVQLEKAIKNSLMKNSSEIISRLEDPIPANLTELISLVGRISRSEHDTDPHKVLASLPITTFLTANLSNLISDALLEKGKKPTILDCPWQKNTSSNNDLNVSFEQNLKSKVSNPIVYHLFGRLNELSSAVITEEHFFEYLIGTTRNNDAIMKVLGSAISDSGLVFLGFHMNDWTFRVLLKSLIQKEGQSRRDSLANVAVQIDIDNSNLRKVENAKEKAKAYYQSYLSHIGIKNIIWGSVQDFIDTIYAKTKDLEFFRSDINKTGGDMKYQVFISYVRSDQEKVFELYDKLEEWGYKPWMDQKNINTAEKYKVAIEKAISTSDFFISCLSTKSVSKRGIVQREWNKAKQILQEKLSSDLYFFPIKLDEVEVPYEIAEELNYQNLFTDSDYEKLKKSLDEGVRRLLASTEEE